jgi:hypothetical protein
MPGSMFEHHNYVMQCHSLYVTIYYAISLACFVSFFVSIITSEFSMI